VSLAWTVDARVSPLCHRLGEGVVRVRAIAGIGLAVALVSLTPRRRPRRPKGAGSAFHPDHAHDQQAKELAVSARPRRVDKGDRAQVTAVLTPCVTARRRRDSVPSWRAVFAEKPVDDKCTATAKSRVRRLTAFSAFSPQDLDSLSATSNTVRVNVRLG
jgi:hypothetical protein